MDKTINPSPFEIEVFYDGECPLCRREINFLKRRDQQSKIRFTDLMAPEFSATALGKSLSEMMAEIHGRLPNGQWLVGVEVFRRLYAAIGWKTPVWISRWPIVSPVLNWAYRRFAKSRLRLTGRCDAGCNLPRERMR